MHVPLMPTNLKKQLLGHQKFLPMPARVEQLIPTFLRKISFFIESYWRVSCSKAFINKYSFEKNMEYASTRCTLDDAGLTRLQ